ncbi:hypothetical protein J6590_027737 [Homalodisca vitripennis]|nr:hypothetical protein J6590_027737 [Homalodisca vitripennis]
MQLGSSSGMLIKKHAGSSYFIGELSSRNRQVHPSSVLHAGFFIGELSSRNRQVHPNSVLHRRTLIKKQAGSSWLGSSSGMLIKKHAGSSYMGSSSASSLQEIGRFILARFFMEARQADSSSGFHWQALIKKLGWLILGWFFIDELSSRNTTG